MNSRVSVGDVDVLPSVGLEPLLDVLGEGNVGVSVDGDVVVVVDGDEVSELEVTVERNRKRGTSSAEARLQTRKGRRDGPSEGSSLSGDTFLEATVSGEH